MKEYVEKEYARWCEKVTDVSLKNELNAFSESEKVDAFYRSLAFGTGGLRGTMGAGTNRMNIYTVARATAGLAAYLKEKSTLPRVAIGYDTRLLSHAFAKTAACVLTAAGIEVYIYSRPLPTPMLSYAVRALACDAGIVITASHNPSEYNGYKVYGADGCQITEEAAAAILSRIEAQDYFDLPQMPYLEARAKHMIFGVPAAVYNSFIAETLACSCLFGDTANKSVRIVYTPLNGTGIEPVMDVLAKAGYRNVHVVEEQKEHDGHFPTCPFPNPELPEAMALGERYAKEMDAALLLATDPDCDRVGVAVKTKDGYLRLTGNEVGILLFDYIVSQKKKHGRMQSAPVVVKTVVTTALAERIAADYGVTVKNVLTGFKYIGETIGALEAAGEEKRYLFGFEESCGYLCGTHVRDKDGVGAAFLVAEMCAFYAARGKSVAERLDEIYAAYGYTQNTLYSYSFPGADGFAHMQDIMKTLRAVTDTLGGLPVTDKEDYLPGKDGLPPSDVLTFRFAEGSVVVRPSGTEPKIKIYISVSAPDREQTVPLTARIRAAAETVIR